MPDHWQDAKDVILTATPPAVAAGDQPDPVSTLLAGIARANRVNQRGEVIRLCRHALRAMSDGFIPAVFLASRLLNAPEGAEEAEAVLLACGSRANLEQRAYVAALISQARAMRGQKVKSASYAREAAALTEDVEDDAFIGVIEARLTISAAWRGDLAAVDEYAERAAARLERAGAHGLAASTLTFRYASFLERGDVDGARALLDRTERLAEIGRLPVVQQNVANTRLALAITTGDEEYVRAADQNRALAHNAYDAFSMIAFLAMLAAWDGRWQDYLAQLRRAEPVSLGQRAMRDALIAVAAGAMREDADARAHWRRAVHRLASGTGVHLPDAMNRQIARALACAVGVTIGDRARAHRAAAPLRGTRQLDIFTGKPEPTQAGWQRLLEAMHASRKASAPAIELTRAQLSILHALATDASITEIARQDPQRRSLATIRSHVQHLYDVLDVRSRTGAGLKAKELQLL